LNEKSNLPTNLAFTKLLSQDIAFGENNGQIQSYTLGNRQYNYVDDTLKQIRFVIRDSVVIRDSIVIKDSIRFIDETKINAKNPIRVESRFELQAYVGVISVRPSIQSPFQTYSDYLKSSEQNTTSLDFGFALNTYYLGWTIGTGLKYYQFGEKTNYTTTKTNLTGSQVDSTTIVTYYDSLGNVWTSSSNLPIADSVYTIQMDTTNYYDTISKSNNWVNSYSRVVIPLNFGYQFKFKSWAFTPRIGLNLEFATNRQKGLYANSKMEGIMEVDTRKFGVSYQLQLEIRRNFGQWHVFVNPYYRNHVGDFINTTDLQRKYSSFGANLGVGVRF
jgi:hypothetical protein